MIIYIFFTVAAFMLSASFHSGSRGGSFVGAKRRLAAEELLQQFRRPPPVPAHMKVGSLSVEYVSKRLKRSWLMPSITTPKTNVWKYELLIASQYLTRMRY